MTRLGYTRYVAQGGDWGSPISSAMARQAPGGFRRRAAAAGTEDERLDRFRRIRDEIRTRLGEWLATVGMATWTGQ